MAYNLGFISDTIVIASEAKQSSKIKITVIAKQAVAISNLNKALTLPKG